MANRTLIHIARELGTSVSGLSFSEPVSHVYNPLDYAWPTHSSYLERFGFGRGGTLLLGMNPGPWGMAQTGVPFGEVAAVRDWLELEIRVSRPADEHPKRPVLGADCPRSEVSGRRLWGWAENLYETPGRFFARFFVGNYCPLQFLAASGRNLTPDSLHRDDRQRLFELCDEALRATIDILEPELVVGVGVFAERRASNALGNDGPRIGRILHPSPASPAANRGWAEAATEQLGELGVEVP
jgi:single-strand selective monofunctional uracil DNA glycosylase